jgi:hypothetical protein
MGAPYIYIYIYIYICIYDISRLRVNAIPSLVKTRATPLDVAGVSRWIWEELVTGFTEWEAFPLSKDGMTFIVRKKCM